MSAGDEMPVIERRITLNVAQMRALPSVVAGHPEDAVWTFRGPSDDECDRWDLDPSDRIMESPRGKWVLPYTGHAAPLDA